MTTFPTPLISFAAVAANLSLPASSSTATSCRSFTSTAPSTASCTLKPADSPVTAAQYSAFAVNSPMSTASTASGSDSPVTDTHSGKGGMLITSHCSTPERAHSPLSLDASTASSSAASSRAPSPTAHLTLVSSPTARGCSAPATSTHVTPSHVSLSPAISSTSHHPVTPPSPAHSSASLSSSASSTHSSSSSTPHASSSSACSSNYRPDRRSARSKRIPLSAQQKAVLEEFFRTNHYPTRDEKTELGAKIHLTSDKVHKWYDNRRTKMNKDGKLRRVEDARMQHLYNNYSDASAAALYSTGAAMPFDVKPLAMPVMSNGGMSAMQLTPMAQSAAVHPFLHNSMMAASAQQDEPWKRLGGMDAQQQLLQAQLQFHLTQSAISMHQQQQQQQQQQQLATAAAVNNFFQSSQLTTNPNSGLGIAASMAAPLNKSTTTSAFHSVTPGSVSPAIGSRSTTTTITTSTSSPNTNSNNSNGLLSPPLKSHSTLDNSPLIPTPVMPLRPLFDPHTTTFATSPSLSFPALAAATASMASVTASPATVLPAHSLLSPMRSAAQLGYGAAAVVGTTQHALMSAPPMYIFRQ